MHHRKSFYLYMLFLCLQRPNRCAVISYEKPISHLQKVRVG